jgi:hypothetical protein
MRGHPVPMNILHQPLLFIIFLPLIVFSCSNPNSSPGLGSTDTAKSDTAALYYDMNDTCWLKITGYYEKDTIYPDDTANLAHPDFTMRTKELKEYNGEWEYPEVAKKNGFYALLKEKIDERIRESIADWKESFDTYVNGPEGDTSNRSCYYTQVRIRPIFLSPRADSFVITNSARMCGAHEQYVISYLNFYWKNNTVKEISGAGFFNKDVIDSAYFAPLTQQVFFKSDSPLFFCQLNYHAAVPFQELLNPTDSTNIMAFGSPNFTFHSMGLKVKFTETWYGNQQESVRNCDVTLHNRLIPWSELNKILGPGLQTLD